MLNIESKLTGNLEADLDRFGAAIAEKVLLSGVAAMAKVMYDEARLNAAKHIKSGLLYSAIYRVYAKDKSSDTRKTYEISWNKKTAPHGHLIEFGHSKAPAYPFIRPAFDRVNDAIEAGKARMAERMTEINTFVPE